MNTAYTKDILLPEKPSELIMLALKDLVTVRDLPGYAIDMDYWHKPFKILKICRVCFAGAVIAGTLKLSKHKNVWPGDFTMDTCDKLFALDEFRRGLIRKGLLSMGIAIDHPNLCLPKYKDDPEGFLMAMTDLANDLALKGL